MRETLKKGGAYAGSPFFCAVNLPPMEAVELISPALFSRIMDRLAHQLLEHHDFSQTDLIGLQPRGVLVADRLRARLKKLLNRDDLRLGALDPTFHRDDFRRKEHPIMPSSTDMNFLIEDRNVILIDDVLFTGRTIRAGMDALLAHGRPKKVELLVLVDRRFQRELPIEPQYVGRSVDSLDAQHVQVEWGREVGLDRVVLLNKKP